MKIEFTGKEFLAIKLCADKYADVVEDVCKLIAIPGGNVVADVIRSAVAKTTEVPETVVVGAVREYTRALDLLQRLMPLAREAKPLAILGVRVVKEWEREGRRRSADDDATATATAEA